MSASATAPREAIVYVLGRSGHDASIFCMSLDELALFLPAIAPGDYWIRRSVVRALDARRPETVEEVDWGVLRVAPSGRWRIESLEDPPAEADFRRAWMNSTLPGPGRDG